MDKYMELGGEYELYVKPSVGMGTKRIGMTLVGITSDYSVAALINDVRNVHAKSIRQDNSIPRDINKLTFYIFKKDGEYEVIAKEWLNDQ